MGDRKNESIKKQIQNLLNKKYSFPAFAS